MLGERDPDQPTSCSRSSAAASRSSARSRLVPPRVEHLALDGDQVGHVVLGPGARRSVAEQCEHRGEHRTPDRRRRVGAQLPPSGPHRERGAHDRPVRRQVGGGDQATTLGHVGGDHAGQLAVVQRAGALLGDQRHGVRQSVDQHPVTRAHPTAVRPAQCAHRLGVPGERPLPHVGEVVARRRAQREPGPGDLFGRRHHLGPRQPAEPGLRQVEGRQRTGDRRRPGPDGHGDAAAVPGAHLVRCHRQVRSTAAGHVHVAVDGAGVRAAGRPYGHVGAAGQRDDARLGHHGDQGRRDSRVHGPAALLGDAQGRQGGALVRRRHRHPGAHPGHPAPRPCRGRGCAPHRVHDPALGGESGRDRALGGHVLLLGVDEQHRHDERRRRAAPRPRRTRRGSRGCSASGVASFAVPGSVTGWSAK